MAAIALLLAGAACTDELTFPDGPIRLAELLPAAEIDSPLVGIPAAASLAELTDVPRRTVLRESFEKFNMRAARWSPKKGGMVESFDDGGRALHLRTTQWGSGYGWVIRAKPNTHYVFSRKARTTRRFDADFAVVESREMTAGPTGPFAGQYKAGRSQALKAHWPAAPESDGTWQTGSISFYTTPRTRSLQIFVRPTSQRQTELFRRGKPKADDKRGDQDIWLDDILLEQLDPKPEQAIALLKAASLATRGEQNPHGIHKRGQFPPLRNLTLRHSAEDANYSYRYALYAPPRTDMRFEVPVKKKACLYFSVCLSQETPNGHAARFEVLVRSEDKEEIAWSQTVTASLDTWAWHEGRVPLDDYAERKIEIILRTTAQNGHPHPMWGDPVIDTPFEGEGLPNVILIAVDTLRADRLGCYGYGKDTSPRLDALAAAGVRFDHVASNSNWTCPSFASIFTGLVPSRHGVFSFGPATPLPSGLYTLAERFRDAGWATSAIAYKTALYDGGYDQGFDVSFNVPRGNIKAEDNLTEALAWLDTHANRRNFLFLHFNDPHQPFTQDEPYITKFNAHPSKYEMTMPPKLKTGGEMPREEAKRDVVRGLYDGEVAYCDDTIGKFLDALVERGLYDDALIVFVSDHGEQLWEHDGFGHGQEMLHDEVVRIPLIVKPSARTPELARNKVVGTQVRGFDVMPTILELAGLDAEADLDAESLVPLMRDGAEDATDRVAIIETSGGPIALRRSKWKYILVNRLSARLTRKADPDHKGRAKSQARRKNLGMGEYLWDLETDPREQVDVAAKHPEVIAELRTEVLDYLLGSRPGHFVVVLGDGSEEQHDVLVGGVKSAVTLFGIQRRLGIEEPQTVAFRGKATSPVVLVAEIEIAGPVVLGDDTRAAAEIPRYQAGDLAELLEAKATGTYLFEGTARADGSGGAGSLDLETLERLKQLGYTGGQQPAHTSPQKKDNKKKN